MNHYELLQADVTADQRAITRAWKQRLQIRHPDRNHSPGASERSIKLLNAAYETLKDPKKRNLYDQAILGARPARPRASAPVRPRPATQAQARQSRNAASDSNDFSSLSWDDDRWVVGHWYARSNGKIFRVEHISASTISVRYATGETGLLAITKRWADWQEYVVKHRPDSPIARARRTAADNARRAAEDQVKREEARRAEAERQRDEQARQRAAREAAQRQQDELERERRVREDRERRDAELRERAEREGAERRMQELAELARQEAVEWEAQLIAFSAGPAAVAYFFQSVG